VILSYGEFMVDLRLQWYLISSFRHDVDEICALLGYCLPTFRDNVSVPSSRVKSPSRKESQQPITWILESTCGVAISRRNDSRSHAVIFGCRKFGLCAD
jgi:hypothetical protein